MSGVVDVLAVIGREIARAGGDAYADGIDLIAARDAVADLIAFADSVIDGPDAGCGCSPVCRCRSPEAVAIWAEAMQDEARTILARIGGAA